MGTWSELRVVTVCHVWARARWAETRERSGEVSGPFEGRLVGDSSLRRQRLESLMASTNAAPRADPELSEVEEYQASSWALKSPRMKVSLLVSLSSRVKSGL